MFLVGLPLAAFVFSRVLRRRNAGPPDDLTRGRTPATPFRMISIIGGGIALVVVLFILLALGAQKVAG